MKLTRNHHDADDLTQATILRALENRAQYHHGTCLQCWLYTLLTSCFHNQKRASKRLVFCGHAADYACELADNDDVHARVETWDALEKVAARSDADILFQAGLGVSVNELGAQFGLGVDNVRQKLSRGRKALRAELMGA